MSTLRNITLNINRQFDSCTRNSTLLVHKVYFWCLINFIPLTVIGNGLVCVVVFRTPKLRNQPLYIFLTSLAVADICVGVLNMPTKGKIEWDNGFFCLPWFLCWVLRLGEIVFFVASTMHLLVISFDRYFAVKYTYEYKMLMCRKTHLLVLLFVWVFAFVWSILSIFQWDAYYDFSVHRGTNGCVIVNRNFFITTYTMFFIGPVCFMTSLYLLIYRNMVSSELSRSQTELTDTTSLVVDTYHKKKEYVSLRSLTIVFVTFAICWTPHVVLTLTLPNDVINTRHDETDSFKTLILFIVDFLPTLDSTLNPFIYVIFNKSFFCSTQKLFRQMRRNKWMKYCADMKRKRHTMPPYIDDISYNEEEDNCFEMEVVPRSSPPRRRFTM